MAMWDEGLTGREETVLRSGRSLALSKRSRLRLLNGNVWLLALFVAAPRAQCLFSGAWAAKRRPDGPVLKKRLTTRELKQLRHRTTQVPKQAERARRNRMRTHEMQSGWQNERRTQEQPMTEAEFRAALDANKARVEARKKQKERAQQKKKVEAQQARKPTGAAGTPVAQDKPAGSSTPSEAQDALQDSFARLHRWVAQGLMAIAKVPDREKIPLIDGLIAKMPEVMAQTFGLNPSELSKSHYTDVLESFEVRKLPEQAEHTFLTIKAQIEAAARHKRDGRNRDGPN